MLAGMPRLTFPYPPLTDGVVWLREPRSEHAEAVTAACQDPAIQRFVGVPVPYTLDSAKNWISSQGENVAANLRIGMLGFDRDGVLLGSYGVPEFDWDAHVAEMGYWTAPEARGRGITVRAVWLLRDWLVNYHDIRTIEMLIDRENAPSRRVAEKAGFLDTGERRVRPRTPEATEPDHITYAWSVDS